VPVSDRAQVIRAAAVIADESGADGLTLAALAARLGVRSQSLYAHVDGLEGLRHDLAVHGQRQLASRLGSAVMGRAGAERSGRWPRRRGLRRRAAGPRVRAPGHRSAARPGGERRGGVHSPGGRRCGRSACQRPRPSTTTCALWAALHGFVTLRGAGLMTRAASTDRSFDDDRVCSSAR
jgi:AcrR family transcriptional regulator